MYPYIGTYQLPQCILYINGHDWYLCDCVIAILSKYIVATIEVIAVYNKYYIAVKVNQLYIART